MNTRIFNPPVFQGSLKKNKYFEGWYFKHVSADLSQVWAFIPGIALSKENKHAFIQVLNGLAGESHYLSYGIEDFSYRKDHFRVEIGRSVFTSEGIKLDIDQDGFSVSGKLSYSDQVRYPSSRLAPGIMGWYSFVPFMECYHGIVSVDHSIHGSLLIKGNPIRFDEGRGYIEKDWGRSFPECWIWLHSNSFEKKGTSLFFSVAKIPWLGNYFMGFISFLYHEGRFYQFSSYNKAAIKKLSFENRVLSVEMARKDLRLNLKASIQDSGQLFAPVQGNMNRRIKESINSTLDFELRNEAGDCLVVGNSARAGLEMIEGIFNYL